VTSGSWPWARTNQGAPLFAVAASSSRWVVDERKSIGQEAPENPGECQGATRGLAGGGGLVSVARAAHHSRAARPLAPNQLL
jgi:hypothetical protein